MSSDQDLLTQFQNSTDPVILVDPQQRAVLATPHAVLLCREIRIGEPISHPQALTALRDPGTPVCAPDGTSFCAMSLRNGMALLHLSPLSAQSEVGQAFRESGSARFMADLAHECNTPLSLVMSALGLMESSGELSEKQKKFLVIARGNTQKLIYLCQNALSLARLQEKGPGSLNREQLELHSFVRSLCDTFRTAAPDPLPVIIHAQPETIPLCADGFLLERSLINLLVNSQKYTRPNNRVEITLSKQPGGVCIVVQDWGAGMDEQTLRTATMRFSRGTTAPATDGSGLGLALVAQFAKLHGGTLALESTLGEGTRVTLQLPHLQEGGGLMRLASSADRQVEQELLAAQIRAMLSKEE